MNNNGKRIVTLSVVLVLLFAGQTLAQTSVLGLFQLGKSTYNEVKAKRPDGKTAGVSEDGGPLLVTKGDGYDINGLKALEFSFDNMKTLVEVNMFLEKRRFNDIKKILSSKYQKVRSYPEVWLLFKASHGYIYLYLPRNEDFVVNYMADAVYRRGKLQEQQTIEYNKKYERENKKALEREAEEEAAKF